MHQVKAFWMIFFSAMMFSWSIPLSASLIRHLLKLDSYLLLALRLR
jgi:hypothetical protein